jgi:hypothetical protein
MKLFFISYDLRIPGQDYPKLIDKLTSMGAERVLLSMWALRGNYTASGLRDTLKDYLDSNDRLLVVENANWASWRAMIDINSV